MMTDLLGKLNDEMAALLAKARPALVEIRGRNRSVGAGTIWHPSGMVVTNTHVLEGRKVEIALADGRNLPAELLASEPSLDLAVLAVEAEGLPVMELGNSRSLRPGDWVVALGNPFGMIGAATAGTLIGRTNGSIDDRKSPVSLLVLDLHLRPGYSGGALLDAQGRLVGINTMMQGPNVGVAVPVDEIKTFLRRAIKKADR
jgi:S1-C subfamily serine protease